MDKVYITFIKYFASGRCEEIHLSVHKGYVEYDTQELPLGGFPWMTVARHYCVNGYNRLGSFTRTCQVTENWSNEAPTCIGIEKVAK